MEQVCEYRYMVINEGHLVVITLYINNIILHSNNPQVAVAMELGSVKIIIVQYVHMIALPSHLLVTGASKLITRQCCYTCRQQNAETQAGMVAFSGWIHM